MENWIHQLFVFLVFKTMKWLMSNTCILTLNFIAWKERIRNISWTGSFLDDHVLNTFISNRIAVLIKCCKEPCIIFVYIYITITPSYVIFISSSAMLMVWCGHLSLKSDSHPLWYLIFSWRVRAELIFSAVRTKRNIGMVWTHIILKC